jgi:hypothetical protein
VGGSRRMTLLPAPRTYARTVETRPVTDDTYMLETKEPVMFAAMPRTRRIHIHEAPIRDV